MSLSKLAYLLAFRAAMILIISVFMVLVPIPEHIDTNFAWLFQHLCWLVVLVLIVVQGVAQVRDLFLSLEQNPDLLHGDDN